MPTQGSAGPGRLQPADRPAADEPAVRRVLVDRSGRAGCWRAARSATSTRCSTAPTGCSPSCPTPRSTPRSTAIRASAPRSTTRRRRASRPRVATADDAVKAELAAKNREYDDKFGYVYLVCASGRSAEELLAILTDRLRQRPRDRAPGDAQRAGQDQPASAGAPAERARMPRQDRPHEPLHPRPRRRLRPPAAGVAVTLTDAAGADAGRRRHRRRRPHRPHWATTCPPGCTACTSTPAAYFAAHGRRRVLPRGRHRLRDHRRGAANITSRCCSRRTPIPPTEGVERCPRSSWARTSTARPRTASSGSTATPRATRSTTSTYPPVCEAISAPRTSPAISPTCCPPTPRSRRPTPTPRRRACCRSRTTAWRWPGTSSHDVEPGARAPASRSTSTPGSARSSTAPSTTTPGSARVRRSAPPRSPSTPTGEWVVGGLKDLVILKSTGSEFAGFLTDPYTILEPTHDRVMATSLVAQWRFTTTDVDWEARLRRHQGPAGQAVRASCSHWRCSRPSSRWARPCSRPTRSSPRSGCRRRTSTTSSTTCRRSGWRTTTRCSTPTTGRTA